MKKKKKYKLSLAGLDKLENQIEGLNEPEIISFNEEGDTSRLDGIYDNNLYSQERRRFSRCGSENNFYEEKDLLM